MPQISNPPPNKIVLKGDYGQYEEGILATGAALPGMNVVRTTAAEAQKRGTYAPGATLAGGTAAGGAATPIKVVREDALQGKTVDDTFAVGDLIFLFIPKKGDVIQVRVLTGETIAIGGGLSANAAGKWVAATVNSAVEALEASGGALAADTLLRVRVN
jgi:hypothetical protein